MGQVLHGSATATEAVRRAIQHSQASVRALAERYGVNQKTVAKWKRRSAVADRPEGAEVDGAVDRGGGDTPDKRKFKVYPTGYIHVDIDRTLKFAYVELHE